MSRLDRIWLGVLGLLIVGGFVHMVVVETQQVANILRVGLVLCGIAFVPMLVLFGIAAVLERFDLRRLSNIAAALALVPGMAVSMTVISGIFLVQLVPGGEKAAIVVGIVVAIKETMAACRGR